MTRCALLTRAPALPSARPNSNRQGGPAVGGLKRVAPLLVKRVFAANGEC